MTARPNFLFIVTDQQRADHLSCNGNPLLRTPHVDALAARGWNFRRFYVACPICMPNRATIMTGRMPSLHGVRDNGIPLSIHATTFVEILRAAGYRTGIVGKSHLQNYVDAPPVQARRFPPGLAVPPDSLAEAESIRREGPDYDREKTSRWSKDPQYRVPTPYYGFEHALLCTRHSDQVQGDYVRWLLEREPNGNALRDPKNPLPDQRYASPQARRTRLPEALYPTTYIADETIAFLENHAARKTRTPFFLQCSFPDPHHPFTPPGKYWDLYDPDDVVLPKSFYDSHDQIPALAAIHDELNRGVADRTYQRPFAVTEREAKELIALTYGMVAMIDDAVGRVLARLASLGLLENTVVIYTSDHGDWMGDHGLMLKGPLHFQGVIRVPFLWADPARAGGGGTTDALAGTLDIARSVLARAGLAPYNGIQGQSLLDVMDGKPSAHDGILIEQETQARYLGFDPGVAGPLRVRSYVTERWRLSLWQDFPWGEFYDLTNDPEERVNLWNHPDAQLSKGAVFERMARTMMAHQDWSPMPPGLA